MPSITRRSFWFAFAVVTLSATRIPAQLTRPASDSLVPRAIFDAFASAVFPARTQVVVGELPPLLTQHALYLPTGAKVVGGIESPVVTMGIVDVPLSPDTLRSIYVTEMPRLGWTLSPQFPGMPSWGFRAAPNSPQARSQGLQFCNGGQMVSVAIARSQNSSGARVTFTSASDTCGSIAEARASFNESPNKDFPSLENPPGTGRGTGGCTPQGRSTRSSSSTSSQTALRTSMTPREIFEHYNRQLTDSGWTRVPAQDDAVQGFWRRGDSTGTEVYVRLIVSSNANAPGCRDAELHFTSLHR